MKILVVDDSSKTVEYLTKGLAECGFIVDAAKDGETGLHLASTGSYALLIIDVMLPVKDGLQLLAELRGRDIATPALFLTARVATEDRVRGLRSVSTILRQST